MRLLKNLFILGLLLASAAPFMLIGLEENSVSQQTENLQAAKDAALLDACRELWDDKLYGRLETKHIIEKVRTALENGANPNAMAGIAAHHDWFQQTALHIAVQAESPQAVRLLLSAGADKNIVNGSGKTAVDLALHNFVTNAIVPFDITIINYFGPNGSTEYTVEDANLRDTYAIVQQLIPNAVQRKKRLVETTVSLSKADIKTLNDALKLVQDAGKTSELIGKDLSSNTVRVTAVKKQIAPLEEPIKKKQKFNRWIFKHTLPEKLEEDTPQAEIENPEQLGRPVRKLPPELIDYIEIIQQANEPIEPS